MEESSQREEESSQIVENLIDKLLGDETQAFLSDYYLNTLFKNDTLFTKGLMGMILQMKLLTMILSISSD